MEALTSLHTFTVRWPGPIDVPASLEWFRRWGDDGIERWDGQVLVRTTRVAGQVIPFACTHVGSVREPAVDVSVPDAAVAPAVEALVQGMFVTAPEALRTLMLSDRVMAYFESRFPGVRPVLQAEFFTALVRSISAQQVNLRWAATTRRRLAEAFGRPYLLGPYQVIHLDVERLATADVTELRALQFTTRKSEYIIALARAVTEGELALEALREAPDDEVTARLTALRGLGRWTAEWFLARSLGRPRVVAGDLGVRKAVGAAYLQGRMPSESEVRSHTAHWGEAAGVAQQLLLHALSEGEMNR
jgi:DNA-3-methyladenine glycosylase II